MFHRATLVSLGQEHFQYHLTVRIRLLSNLPLVSSEK